MENPTQYKSRVDLHTHSTASDGSLSPSELVIAASEAGIETLALTDHDTLAGLDEAMQTGGSYGVRVIPGIEFSVELNDGSLHLLGYGSNPHSAGLQSVIEELVVSRCERNEKMIKRLNQLGMDISLEDLPHQSSRGTLGRAHIAQALVRRGFVTSMDEAFDRFLARGRAAYFDRKRLTLREACCLIHDNGGVTVWAHPGFHGTRVSDMLVRLSAWGADGLDGLESDYSGHTLAMRDLLREVAVDNGMIFTGGSDFHGAVRPTVKLGDGPEGEGIADECLENLDRRLEQFRP